MVLGPTRVLNPKCILIGSADIAGLTSVTDRQTGRRTDHAIQSVTMSRIHTFYVVLQNGAYIKISCLNQNLLLS